MPKGGETVSNSGPLPRRDISDELKISLEGGGAKVFEVLPFLSNASGPANEGVGVFSSSPCLPLVESSPGKEICLDVLTPDGCIDLPATVRALC